MPKIRVPDSPWPVEVSEAEARELEVSKQAKFDRTVRGAAIERRSLERRIEKWREARRRAEETLFRSEETFLECARRINAEARALLLRGGYPSKKR